MTRGVAVVLFTDLVGSTELRGRLGEDAADVGTLCSLARTRLEWARTLLTRGEPGDREQAGLLLGQALATARDLGLGGVERQAVALLQK